MTTDAVPFYSQKVDYGGEDSGFPDEAAIAQWESNACGIASLRMVIDALTGQRPRYWDLLQRGLAIGGYIEAGWIHHKLLELGQEFGLRGRTHRRRHFGDLLAFTEAGSLCIVSVTVGFWGGQTNPRTGLPFAKGGHLVLAYRNGEGALAVNHPSSLPEGNRRNWVVSPDEWERSMSGNFIEFWGGDE